MLNLTAPQRKRLYIAVGTPAAVIGLFCAGLFGGHAGTGDWGKAVGWGILSVILTALAGVVIGIVWAIGDNVWKWVKQGDDDA